jgi:hypothetical protein
MFKLIRKFTFGQTRFISLVDIKTKVFSAVVDNSIITHQKRAPSHNGFPVSAFTEDGFGFQYIQHQEEWSSIQGVAISIALTPALKSISLRIEANPTLDKFFTITPGCKPYQVGKGIPKQTREIVAKKPFTSEIRENAEFRPLLRGRLINKYEILWDHNLWIKFGGWLAEPRHTANYDSPEKIVIRQTGDSLIAALDDHQFIVMNNMFTVVPREASGPTRFALAALNSSVLNWYYQTCINPEKGEALAEIKKGHLTRLPLAIPNDQQLATISSLSDLIMLSKRRRDPVASVFLEDLIDACVMECYFRDHMAERDLLFLDDLAPHLAVYASGAPEQQQREFIEQLHRTLNSPTSSIRNRLLRISADSPDLLAVIKAEGKA